MIFKHHGKPFMAGVNVEVGSRERPRFVVGAVSAGSVICVSHNDGYYTKISDSPCIVIHDLYIGRDIYIPIDDINKAIESLNDETVDSPDMLMKKSESVGLHAYQPVKGYGKVCTNCENKILMSNVGDNKFCERDDTKLTRYNDLMEYCTVDTQEGV